MYPSNLRTYINIVPNIKYSYPHPTHLQQLPKSLCTTTFFIKKGKEKDIGWNLIMVSQSNIWRLSTWVQVGREGGIRDPYPRVLHFGGFNLVTSIFQGESSINYTKPYLISVWHYLLIIGMMNTSNKIYHQLSARLAKNLDLS